MGSKVKILLNILLAALLVYFAIATFILNLELWKLKSHYEDLYLIAIGYESELDELAFTFSNLPMGVEKREIINARQAYIDSLKSSSPFGYELPIEVNPDWDSFRGFNYGLKYDFSDQGKLQKLSFERRDYSIEEVLKKFR